MRILWTLLCVLTLQPLFAAAPADVPQSGGNLTAQQIAVRLVENNRKRHDDLRAYTGEREYHLLYTGFPGRHEADLVVRVNYQAPAEKRFTVLSQSGSSIIVNRVFKKLLDTETETANAESQAAIAVSPENYDFELLGQEQLNGRQSYILKVEPKTQNRLLYRGKIWVDASDFAVARIEAKPAKKPSVWISNTMIHHSYVKVGEFWLPEQNESTSEVRLGGRAVLSIKYRNYKVMPQSATVAEKSGQVANP